MQLDLRISLRSAASFARGDGLAGQIDNEVMYDPATGLPFIHGRTVKGLLAEECANIHFSLEDSHVGSEYTAAAVLLFGAPGAGTDDEGVLSVSHALMPLSLRVAVSRLMASNSDIRAREILEALTDVRRQTAASEYGAPIDHTLRSARVVSPGVVFVSLLTLPDDISETAKGLLAACVRALRRGGTSRNRGRGRLEASLSRPEEFQQGAALQGFVSRVKSAGGHP